MPTVGQGGNATPLGHKEAIGRDAECGAMMKAAPAAAFEVHQVAQLEVFRQVRDPVFARFGFATGPLHEQPLCLPPLGKRVVAVRRADAYGSEARAERTPCAFPPDRGIVLDGDFPGGRRVIISSIVIVGRRSSCRAPVPPAPEEGPYREASRRGLRTCIRGARDAVRVSSECAPA